MYKGLDFANSSELSAPEKFNERETVSINVKRKKNVVKSNETNSRDNEDEVLMTTQWRLDDEHTCAAVALNGKQNIVITYYYYYYIIAFIYERLHKYKHGHSFDALSVVIVVKRGTPQNMLS